MIERLVASAIRRRWVVLVLALVLTAVSGLYAAHRFSINTDVTGLITPNEAWRKDEIAFEHAFPRRADLIVAVIDADTPERADEAANLLTQNLGDNPKVIRRVRRADGGPFYDRNGFLLMPQEELERTTEGLVKQQAFLGVLAADPTLRGVVGVLGLGARAVVAGNAKLEDLVRPVARIDEVFQAVLAGGHPRLSWQLLLSGQDKPSTADLRRFVIIQPHLNYSALQPALEATELIRQKAADLRLTPAEGVRLRLTGQAALADEEFATISENAFLNNSVTVAAIALILFLALRSGRLIVAVLATTFAGLVVTMALGLLMVGQLNPISVAFTALFVGLGVDFGIQFAVRYRAERFERGDLDEALRGAARGVGWSLTLAAVSLLAGFFSFLPTAFRGVSELGLIAGVGMIVAYFASLTVLPALIAVLQPKTEPEAVETSSLAAVDHWIIAHRKFVLIVTAILVLAGAPLLFRLDFDSNPMHLRSDKVESVATYLDLTKDPETSPNTIDVLVPSVADLAPMAKRLEALPEVARTVDLETFVPPAADQEAKLAVIKETAEVLDPTLRPSRVAPTPTDADDVTALRNAATAFAGLADGKVGDAAGRDLARRFAGTLRRLADGTPAQRAAANEAVSVTLVRLLERLRALLGPTEPITRAALPPSLLADWIGEDGQARIEVHAKGNANDNAVLADFAHAVRTVAPHATGAPISTTESGRTIVRAFIEAGVLALASIFVILVVALRRPIDVALTLGPLVLATLMTLEAAYLIGMPLNFANIIAMPLMLAVGVAFHIYYVIAWRAGVADMLASSLTRAIFFSALTTGTAFGSLCLSSHPGTASMGKLLALSLFFTLLAAFIIVPAFLGPPPHEGERDAAPGGHGPGQGQSKASPAGGPAPLRQPEVVARGAAPKSA